MKLLNKIKVISGATMLSVSFLTTSCEFLDIVPPEQATLKDATQTEESTLGFLFSCYNNVWNPLKINTTDEYTFPAQWGGHHRYMSYGLVTPNNLYDDNRWLYFWQSINRTNLFLRELEGAQCSEESKDEMRAEAYFLLAYYHYELLQYFGPIPIMDTYQDTNTQAGDFKGRLHYDYVVDWIVDILDNKVINNPYLPETTAPENMGRASKVIARALKARILLYAASPLWNGEFSYPEWRNVQETPGYGYELVSNRYSEAKWTRAKTACEEALESALGAGLKLYDNVDYIDDTQTDIKKKGLYPFIPGLENPDDAEGMAFRKRVLMLRNLMTLKQNEGNTEIVWGLAKDIGIMSYILPLNILTKTDGTPYNGQSALSPTLYTVEHFYTKDGDLPKTAAAKGTFPAESEWLTRAGISGRNDLIKLNCGREPRFYAWLAFDHGDYGTMLAEEKPLMLQMKDSQKQGYNNASSSSNYCSTGYLSQKWIRVDQSLNKSGNWSNSSVNKFPRPIIRMAELYLNLAECQAALGDKGALATLNNIRKRAGIRDLVDADLTSEMTLMDWVRNERFVELWSEGHRWNDVRRWVKGKECFSPGLREGLDAVHENPTFEQFNTRTVVDQQYAWYNRMYIAPIGAGEVQKNQKLVQAPGY